MDVILDGEPTRFDASTCANLAELVAAAERFSVSGEDRVVVAVEVDGRPLEPEELGLLAERSLDGVGCVAIHRRPTVAVARSVLEQGADYTGQIVEAIGRTVDHYRSGRSDLASGLLADVTDSLTVLTGITASVAKVLEHEARSLARVQMRIQPWLEQMLEAQRVGDPILIADTLDYEVAPRIAQWGEVMRALGSGSESAAATVEAVLSS
ncbi:MAG: hypothetical protein R3F16_13045 [Myxococcota bacterium]